MFGLIDQSIVNTNTLHALFSYRLSSPCYIQYAPLRVLQTWSHLIPRELCEIPASMPI